MMASDRFYDIDITTAEGQAEILEAWSTAALGLGQAASILKITHNELLETAVLGGSSPPSSELVAMRDAELEARFRPLARRSEQKRVRESLEMMVAKLDEDILRMTHVIEWSGAPELQQSRFSSQQAVALMEDAKGKILPAVALLAEGVSATEIFRDLGVRRDGVEE